MNKIPNKEEWGAVTPPGVRLPQLDRLGEEGVNIQCTNSSDFVIGKQTNFNGPVTIISCADVLEQRLREGNEGKIVIRDPVLSQSAAKQMQKLAAEKQKAREDGQQRRSRVVKKLARVTMKFPSVFCLVIILSIAGVTVFYGVTATEGKATDEMPPQDDGKAYSYSLNTRIAHPPVEGDVNIQCLQSSEFVVGKQTNFNGCVTIISCVDAPAGEKPSIQNGEFNQEKIIIKDKLVSPSTTDLQAKSADGEEKSHLVFKRLGREIWMIPLFICVGLLVASVVALVYLTAVPLEESDVDNNGTYKIYWKEKWGGKPPRSTVEMKLPIPYVVISHTVTTLCHHLKACSLILRNMQEYHLNLDFADIAYNFLVDSSGNIYEGRGWSRRNVKGGFVNGRNIDIALIGDFSGIIFPTEKMLEGLKCLLELGVKTGKISQDYSLLAANSTYSTLSPGKNVYEIIMHWPHFDPDPTSHVKDYYD